MYINSRNLLAAVGSLAAVARAQTPEDFQPGSLVNLKVNFQNMPIDPPGTLVPNLESVAQQPSLALGGSQLNPQAQFSVFMIDIDVVQQGVKTTVLHWFQPDMLAQGENLVVNPQSRNQAAAYFGPSPPPGPPHRYVQVLFEQPNNFTVPACFAAITDPNNRQGRLGFDINQFVQVAGLRRPLAGNNFRAQNPQQVDPALAAQRVVGTALQSAQCSIPTVKARSLSFPPRAYFG